MSRLFVLLAAICGWLAIACSDSGSSDGSGGASVGGNGGGGGPSTMPPNDDGTCQEGYALQQKADEPSMVCIKTNDGNGGSSGNGGGGSSGSAGDTPPIADIGTTLPDTGFGGSGGGPTDAALPVEQCPYWEDITDDRDPCRLPGRWTEMTDGWVEITVTKTSSTMSTVTLEGENIMFQGTFTGEVLPLERNEEIDGNLYNTSIDIDDEGYMIFTVLVNGNQDGREKFFRSN